MAAAYDNSVAVQDFSVTTLTTGSFTIGSGASRYAMVVLSTLGAPGTITTLTVGGVAGSLVSSAAGNDGSWWHVMYKVANPPSGSQVAVATWTNSFSAALTVITATGASDVANGNYAQTVTTAVPIIISANAGDLTGSFVADTGAGSTHNSSQTIRIAGQLVGADTGPGTAGPITHTWTNTGAFAGNAVGAAFISATASNQLAWTKA